MRIAIVAGSPEDERHLGRLAERAGYQPGFIRARGGARSSTAHEPSLLAIPGLSAPAPGVLEHVLERIEREASAEASGGLGGARPRARVFDAGAEAAVRVLASVRRDPYFDRVGALLVLQAEQAGAMPLPGGFDDFVLLPCSVDELTIRVRALGPRRAAFRRASPVDDAGVVVDESSRDVIVDGRAVQLTAREFALFTYLCEWRGQVLSREHLLARVWGSRYSGGRRTVDIHVRRLRAKLGASLAIETLRGSGYRLRREPDPGSEAAPDSGAAGSGAFGAAQMPEPFSKVS